MSGDFHRLAIVNRGEAAMRLIHAVRELNGERPQQRAIRTIALYTEPDRHGMFVREADEATSLGAATYVDPRDGERKSAYLDYERLRSALQATQADAVWVGWGFVAEHADFAELCEGLGLVFIGPPASVMRVLGDKIAAKRVAERLAIPVVPWSGGPLATLGDAQRQGEIFGYPLMIKATAGGGGRGIRRVRNAAELEDAFAHAQSEARKAFGDSTVLLERCIGNARHVEVQILGDHHGTTWAVGVRDCTIQRRNQKVIEEAPSPVLTAAQDQWLRAAAVRIGDAVGYRNAGTVEFLFDPNTRAFFFMEVNTRLQVEHPVTEVTTGIDLVKLQLEVAAGKRLEGEPPVTAHHAIEVRLNAEDPDNGFAPSPGVIDLLRLPTGPGLRVDTGVGTGDLIPAEFDSMIAKVIATGQTRAEALARLRRALLDSAVAVRGGTTNKAFLLELLRRPEVCACTGDNAWLDNLVASGPPSRPDAGAALVHTAIAVYESELEVEQAQFFATAVRGRPYVRPQAGHTATLRYCGQGYELRVCALGAGRYRLEMGGRHVEVRRECLGPFDFWLRYAGRRMRVLSVMQGADYLVEIDGVAYRVARGDAGLVRAPSPAVVLSILVQPGVEVAAGERLLMLEAMKIEMPVCAPFAGRVRAVMVTSNVQVDAGAVLVQLEAFESDVVSESRDRVVLSFQALPEPVPPPVLSELLEQLRALMLGFDVDAEHARRLLAMWTEAARARPAADSELCRAEDDLLAIFADLCALFRRQPAWDDPEAEDAMRTEEYLLTYLRAPELAEERLPATFLEKLRRALGHYGVARLERAPAHDASLLRIFKSQQRRTEQGAVVLNLLERRLRCVDLLAGEAIPPFRAVLDQVVAVTHGRFAALSDLAREVRYRYFDRPSFEATRARVYHTAEEDLVYLARVTDAPDRSERVRALVECPQPLVGILAGRFAMADASARMLMLEVLTRRYYRMRDLERVCTHTVGSHCVVTAEYDHEGRRIHVVATHGAFEALAEAAAALQSLLRGLPAEEDVVVDFYLWRTQPPEPDATAVGATLGRVAFGRRLRRIVVVVSGPDQPLGMGGVQHFTYRPSGESYAEERLYRGLHPMMGKRLHLWRLSNFDIERLPSVEDVYLFHAVARSNPKDERLFAVAEVRDLTPVRNHAGRAVQLPYLERMLMEALGSIRQFQASRPPPQRLVWNRVLLYVWPPLTLEPEELSDIIAKLAPATQGLGIEQVVVRARVGAPGSGPLRDTVFRVSNPYGTGLLFTAEPPPEHPLEPLSEYDQKVLRMRQRGLAYPYEVIKMITPGRQMTQAQFPPGEFVEHDLDTASRFVPVRRPPGQNIANVVGGVIRNFTTKHPEGMVRVILLGDPSKAMGAVAEAECRRIIAALDLAERMGVPLEWFPVSAGAKISMDSGTENMDWIARVLRRLIEFTQAGGEINVIVNGINVGAQPYWNAEATMLLHTRGILVMTPQGAMVLTGKQALDYSGSVSAEDNQGIGGFERIMGPNGQAQYWARDISEAAQILFRHYDHTYVAPGECFPRRAATTDPIQRNVCLAPLSGGAGDFTHVGDIFSDAMNPDRKRPFDVRMVMGAVVDQDHPPLERWAAMRDAEIAVVWDVHLGGLPVCLIGIESRNRPRLGFLPADGPDHWTAGTLFPRSSKKIARAINTASGNRPLVILANLSGFDGSPESLRELQLEYGAEIGRAVVNFEGPIVFCVISRYHGGAYVVFSGKLNEQLEAAALEGSYASVIGGAPAAAVVFAGEVEARTRNDPRLRQLEDKIAAAEGGAKATLRAAWDDLFAAVHAEKLGEVAAEFDRVHTVQRAVKVGSLDRIIAPRALRPYLVDAVERGMRRCVSESPARADAG